MITPANQNPNLKVDEAAPSPFGFKNIPATDTPIKLQLEGKIPSWVNGVMYRTSSGKYNLLLNNDDTFHVEHPFDGLAMIHRFEISGDSQTVNYNSRYTSNSVEKRIEERDPTLFTFGPDPCKTIFGKIQSVYHHISRSASNAALQENDPEFDVINVTITPNFPLGERLEKETGVKRGEALVVKRDHNTLQLVHPESLKPLKMFTYGHISEQLQGQLCASHHQYDEDTDEYFNFMVKLGPLPTFQTFSIGPYLPCPSEEKGEMPAPKTRLHQPIWRHLGAWKTLEALKPSYIHSFSMTKNYIIIPNFPYYYSFGGLSAIYYSSAYQTFYWDETRHTLFHVIDRHTGNHVATYEAEPCFAFHTANAWDEEVELPGGRRERVVFMDYCTYENPDIVDASFELGKTPTGTINLDHVQPIRFVCNGNTDEKEIAPSQVRRYRLGNVPVPKPDVSRWKPSWANSFSFSKFAAFNKRRVASYTIVGHDLEMSCYNSKYKFKSYKYCWGICESRHAPPHSKRSVVNGLIKLDLDRPHLGANTDKNSSAKIWDKPGCSCAEPVFIPHPEGKEEDDGVILSIVNTVLDNGSDSCFLLVLDASSMKEIARTTIGSFNAFLLHSSFVNKEGRGVTVN